VIDLQQARREAADRFLAIGMAHLPDGWTYAFRKSLTGRCYCQRKHIDAPRPVTRKALYIWLHECAHAHLHAGCAAGKPVHVKEHEAEMWAHATMRAHGVPVPKTMTDRAKRYVASKIGRAIRNGATSIDGAALRFATRRKP
jgi:hypothetical protein